MDPKIVAALFGTLSAIVTCLIVNWTNNRRLRAELISKHRTLFIAKQIEACEELWAIFEAASFSEGDNRVIMDLPDEPKIVIVEAKQLNKNIAKVFHQKCGLYFSRQLRRELFKVRDYIREELIKDNQEDATVPISKKKAKEFRGKLTNIRLAIRREIGTENLTAAQDGPLE